jgi:hypothetical protein
MKVCCAQAELLEMEGVSFLLFGPCGCTGGEHECAFVTILAERKSQLRLDAPAEPTYLIPPFTSQSAGT